MTEPTIICPQCRAQIALNESLAAPLVEAARREYEHRLEQNTQECVQREQKVREQEQALERRKQDWQAGEEVRLQKERKKIAEEESRRAATKFSLDLNQKSEEIHHLHEVLKGRDESLRSAAGPS